MTTKEGKNTQFYPLSPTHSDGYVQPYVESMVCEQFTPKLLILNDHVYFCLPVESGDVTAASKPLIFSTRQEDD